MKSTHFTIIQLEQGTQEWIEWRHTGIGASDAPIIMGENPWKSVEELLQEKRGPARDSNTNEAMSRGIMLEPEARSCYIARTGNDVKPACLQSNQYPWFRASVDGISSNRDVIVEIKCGKSVYRYTTECGCVPDYYYGQLQHILAVSGFASIDFWCFLPDCPQLLIPVPRNEEYIERLVATEEGFWKKVQRKTGLFGRLLGAFASTDDQLIDGRAKMTIHDKENPTQDSSRSFSATIAGFPVRAEVPIEAKAKCDRLLAKPNPTLSDNEYLNQNYWVTIYYKDQRHGYHGVKDIWTHSARELPELVSLHDWIYSILGKKKADGSGGITTIRTWQEDGTIYALGVHDSLSIILSFKPRGYVLNFALNDNLRWEDRCSYNTRTGHSDFPYYYSSAQLKIIEWATEIFQQKSTWKNKA